MNAGWRGPGTRDEPERVPERGGGIGRRRDELLPGGGNPGIGDLRGRHGFGGKRSLLEHQQIGQRFDGKGALGHFHVGGSALQPPRHPGIHRLAAVLVVVVFGRHPHRLHAIRRAVELVDRAHRRVLDLQRLLRPVAGGRDHQERTGCDGRRDLDVRRSQPEAGRVLAQAAALHVQRDHVDRHGDLHAAVNRREQERLGTAAGLARRGQRVAAHIRKGLEKIERPDAVPQLQPREAQPPQRLATAAERVRQLPAVVVADHVVAEDDEALTREADCARRTGRGRRVLETAVRPVPVRREDGRERAVTDRPIQVARHEEPRNALEVDL